VCPACCVCSHYLYTQGTADTDLCQIKKVRRVLDMKDAGYTWVIMDWVDLAVVPGNESSKGFHTTKISKWMSSEQKATGFSSVLYTTKPGVKAPHRTDDQVISTRRAYCLIDSSMLCFRLFAM
jgi:hypothetical protein